MTPNTSREGPAELEREIRAEMIKAINRTLHLDPGPTRAAHRTAAAEYAAILLALSNKSSGAAKPLAPPATEE